MQRVGRPSASEQTDAPTPAIVGMSTTFARPRMNSSLSSLALALALAAGTLVAVTGCERLAPVAAASPVTVGSEIDDAVVGTKVRAALLGNQDIKGYDIKVETRKGVVLLSGFVDNQGQVERAIALVQGIEGVSEVQNGMALKGGKTTVGNKLDDSIITTRVKAALLDEINLKSSRIAVITRKGEVQLSGFVDSRAQIDRAIAVAQAVAGVQGVTNEMSVNK